MGVKIQQINIWKELKETELPIVLYGAGGQGQRVFKYLRNNGINPVCFCETKHEKDYKIFDVEVLSYFQLRKRFEKFILIISVLPKKAREILQYLEQNGEKNTVIPLCIPYKIEDAFIEEEIDKEKLEEFNLIYNLFEDDLSKKVFNKLIHFKRSGNGMNLLDDIAGDSFFDDPILPKKHQYCYIDCGAYTGDTIIKFLQFNGLHYEKIIGVEMEKGNFRSLMNFINYAKLEKVGLYNFALDDKKGYVAYYTKSDYNFFNANLFREFDQVSSIQEKKLMKESGTKGIKELVEAITLDELVEKEETKGCRFDNTIIKLNAMCADYKIIKGSQKLINKYKPIFIIDYGTSPEHIIDIPLLLKSINENYKFYLRQKNVFGDSKSILYCIYK
ncbi:FkbM family methyltransferase [Oceanirhabdus seepicola]|uniref:FkbM family methyltransferase n=1 Tax=Oceanirhabdus seepicola TaxID=2828781 RepID=A0A9J6P8X9_9CLOT|nr:FkbM family methyltransferase [Oceanirhabdus seepicola]MCM1992628.1 FkbM family methyltransferase [Oceanirhabdus seepicola]